LKMLLLRLLRETAMRKRIAYTIYGVLFAVMGVAACAPVTPTQDEYAQVCDDAKEPDCAPDRKVVVE
jgi:hypothetical protein